MTSGDSKLCQPGNCAMGHAHAVTKHDDDVLDAAVGMAGRTLISTTAIAGIARHEFVQINDLKL